MTHAKIVTTLLLVLVFNGCGGGTGADPGGADATSVSTSSSSGHSSSSSASSSSGSSSSASSSGTLGEGSTPGHTALKVATYQGASNSSAAVWSGDHFFNFDDEVNVIGLYKAGTSAPAVATWDVAKALKLKKEADFEGATRIGNTLLVITSHGRNASGKLKKERFRFASMTITGEGASTQLEVNGYSDQLVQNLLDPNNWQQPATDVIALIEQTTQLEQSRDADLAPKADGLNIEGLTALPDGRAVIGLRNPVIDGMAILILINNPLETAMGARASIETAVRLDLSGYGVRAMAWSQTQQLVYIIAGASDTQPDFQLYSWDASLDAGANYLTTLTSPKGGSIEAILPHQQHRALRLLLDQDTLEVNGRENKSLPTKEQRFEDMIYYLR